MKNSVGFSFLSSSRLLPLGLALVAFFVYAPFLNTIGVEYRDDEIFYVRAVQEMQDRQDWISPTYFGKNRFQKPIFFYWLIGLAYSLWGAGLGSARLVSVVAASLTVGLTVGLARRLFDRRTAVLAGLILITWPLFARHARVAVVDMTLNFFVVLALVAVYCYGEEPYPRKRWRWIFALACGLGFLTKGFVAIVIPFGVCGLYAILSGRRDRLKSFNLPMAALIVALLNIPWFAAMIARHGRTYLDTMLMFETTRRVVGDNTAGVGGWLKAILTVNVPFYTGVFFAYGAPWSLFVLGAMKNLFRQKKNDIADDKNFLFLSVWFWTVFVFFCLIKIKIHHYLLILTTPAAIGVASVLNSSCRPGSSSARILNSVFVFLAGWVTLVLMATEWLFLETPGGIMGATALIGIVSVFAMVKVRDKRWSPVVLALCLCGVFMIMPILSRAGLSNAPVFSHWARLMEKDAAQTGLMDYIVVVGSHDLHEKEIQMFFPRKLIKAGHSHKPLNAINLRHAFDGPHSVYCLLTQDDYNFFHEVFDRYPDHSIMAEAEILRKRFFLDGNFIKFLLKGDRDRVRSYLKERVILVKKYAFTSPNELPRPAAGP